MRALMLLDEERPKVEPTELKSKIERSGIKVTRDKADFAIVVGGDGLFGRYGRTTSIPLLFIGVRSKRATGSKAHLASAYYDELPSVLRRIKSGEHQIVEHRRLEVLKNGKSLGEVFTDAYLERGAESNCLRYRVKVVGQSPFEEAAIGNGVVISTNAGATGYYSYPDRIWNGRFHADANSRIPMTEIGICHINPTYIERSGSKDRPFRYTLPWGDKVQLSLTRPADARLYGTGPARGGLRVSTRDLISIVPGRHATKVVSLPNGD